MRSDNDINERSSHNNNNQIAEYIQQRKQSQAIGHDELEGAIGHGDDLDEEEEEEVYEFDLPVIQFISNAEKRHKILAKLLGVDEDEKLRHVFITVSTLVDPMTQPMESDNYVVSLQVVSDLLISLCFDPNSLIADFELSSRLFKIVEASIVLLNCSDDVKLRNLNNSDLKIDWRTRLNEWTPHGLNNQDMRLIYMINCACILTIYKLYAFNETDLCLNPFLGFFLKIWKIFTNVTLLGLEIDRRVEQVPNQSTPNLVKQVIRGSTAVRYVLASILNDDIENRYHDFNHLNILDFMSPYGRRNGSGALYADVRWYVGAMLALGSELSEVVETLVDLEPDDRYDEDVRYMFDHEYDDFHHDILYPEEYDEEGYLLRDEPIIYEDEEGNWHKVVEKRCTCQFFDDEFAEDEEKEISAKDLGEDVNDEDDENSRIPIAIRSNEQDIDFDEMGRDWRDVPREDNVFFNDSAQLGESDCYNWEQLIETFESMSKKPVSTEICQKVINSIARAVKLESEEVLLRETRSETADPLLVTPDRIYEKWSDDFIFERMLALNPETCYCMLDELFMANGYRRVLIWFITHMALSFSLINYIFELLTGIRGDSPERKQKFIFSRQGPLVLSDIEKSMLLHEFLNNCLIYLSKSHELFMTSNSQIPEQTQLTNASDFEKCIKIVKLICLMINKLIEKDMIGIDEYKVELTGLLIAWIGIIPEAKALFFKINHGNKNGDDDDESKSLKNLEMSQENTDMMSVGPKTHPDDSDFKERPPPLENQLSLISHPSLSIQKTNKRPKKFNKQLKTLLGNVISKKGSTAMLFHPFFELIEQDSNSSPNPLNDGVFPERDNEPDYIRGVLRPLKREEGFEDERA